MEGHQFLFTIDAPNIVVRTMVDELSTCQMKEFNVSVLFLFEMVTLGKYW